jgi:hypothetical protein
METLEFWQELEREFAKPGDRAIDLHATHDSSDMHAVAGQMGAFVAFAIADSATASDEIKALAVNAFSAARMAVDGTRSRGFWVISGGPHDDHERDVLQSRFMSMAARAAAAAGAAAPTASLEEAVQSWLHLLRDRLTAHLRASWWIEDLYGASALVCHHLGTDAYRAQQQPVGKSGRLDKWIRARELDARRRRRQEVILPLLMKARLSRKQWAEEAGYTYDVAEDYLLGKTDPAPQTRANLAQRLGLETLPD